MRRLPIFPLSTVLIPGGILPLHIFEARYRALMADLTSPAAGLGEFGVVLIERGNEVGGGEVRHRVGTVVRLVGHQVLPDGRWVAVAAGLHPFEVHDWLPDDPYPAAMVEDLADDEGVELTAEQLARAAQHVRRTLALAAELGHQVAPLNFVLSDNRREALWQLCSTVPLGPLDSQRLLETRSPAARCRLLIAEAEELASVLAFRLAANKDRPARMPSRTLVTPNIGEIFWLPPKNRFPSAAPTVRTLRWAPCSTSSKTSSSSTPSRRRSIR